MPHRQPSARDAHGSAGAPRRPAGEVWAGWGPLALAHFSGRVTFLAASWPVSRHVAVGFCTCSSDVALAAMEGIRISRLAYPACGTGGGWVPQAGLTLLSSLEAELRFEVARLEPLLDGPEEAGRVGAVDEPVVVG